MENENIFTANYTKCTKWIHYSVIFYIYNINFRGKK